MSVDARQSLLCWYAVDKRRLPWRAEAGERADPYRVWLSEIMLQQTTVAAVKPYFERFTTKWPDVGAVAAADEADVMSEWAGLGYYARARNLVACARRERRAASWRTACEHGDGCGALRPLGRASAVPALPKMRLFMIASRPSSASAVVSGSRTPLPAARPEVWRATTARHQEAEGALAVACAKGTAGGAGAAP